MAERRTVMVAARVPAAERAALQRKAAAAGVSPSALLRQAMVRTRTWRAPALAVERERTRQIARTGTLYGRASDQVRSANCRAEAGRLGHEAARSFPIRATTSATRAMGTLIRAPRRASTIASA